MTEPDVEPRTLQRIRGEPGLIAVKLAALGWRSAMAKGKAPGYDTLKPERVQNRLTVVEAGERIAGLPGWELSSDGRSIRRTIRLLSLPVIATFLDLVAALAELSRITPGIALEEGGALTLRLGSTREGLYPEDFDFAETLDGAAALGRLD